MATHINILFRNDNQQTATIDYLQALLKRYTGGQEDQPGTQGLVTNAVVLWDTIYMQAALDHLRSQNENKSQLLAAGHVAAMRVNQRIERLPGLSATIGEERAKGSGGWSLPVGRTVSRPSSGRTP